ncbi:MAG: cell envelope integrity protein TolA [Nitrospirota bacterium]|nr:cell envelope integrity protein TolA [Nitrospirota bacterium]
MKGPSLQRTTFLSAALHLTFFVIAALILRHSRNVILPSPYEVSLVGQAKSSRATARDETPVKEPSGTRITEQEKQADKTIEDKKADMQRKANALSEIEAKKKIKRISELRSIVSIRSTDNANTQKTAAQGKGSGPAQGTLFDSYYGKITNQIRQDWVYPDTGEKNLEAVIAVRIARDGTVSVQGIEKSSGNALFDRSAMRALAKASPVAPPPYEMEIGMRFYP